MLQLGMVTEQGAVSPHRQDLVLDVVMVIEKRNNMFLPIILTRKENGTSSCCIISFVFKGPRPSKKKSRAFMTNNVWKLLTDLLRIKLIIIRYYLR